MGNVKSLFLASVCLGWTCRDIKTESRLWLNESGVRDELMFSIFCLIKAWKRSDCYAAPLPTANSYTRLLSVLLLHPEVSLGCLIDSLKSLYLPLSLWFVFCLTVDIFAFIPPSLIVFAQSVSCLNRVHPRPHCEQSWKRRHGWSSSHLAIAATWLHISASAGSPILYLPSSFALLATPAPSDSLWVHTTVPAISICSTNLLCRQPRFNYCRPAW